MKRNWLFWSFFITSFFHGYAVAQEIKFGIVPQQSATELARNWIPVMQEIAHRAGIKVLFQTAPDINTFEERLKAGEYDVAYMNPYHYTVFSKSPGYVAFAKEENRKLVGIIVVKKNSGIKDLSQLQGKTVLFPSPAAFAASILPRAEFDRKGIDINEKFVLSHDSVYKAVAQGIFPAGGGIKRTFESIDTETFEQLQILATTPSYVPHAIAHHPRVDPKTVAILSQVLTAIGKDETGKRLLEPLSMKGFVTAQDREWDEIRKLNIKQSIGIQPKAPIAK